MLVIERWILARLRNRKFFSLMELTHAIALLLNDLNQRAFKELLGIRRSAYELLDATDLQGLLPANRFELSRWKSALGIRLLDRSAAQTNQTYQR